MVVVKRLHNRKVPVLVIVIVMVMVMVIAMVIVNCHLHGPGHSHRNCNSTSASANTQVDGVVMIKTFDKVPVKTDAAEMESAHLLKDTYI